ncbi:MAG TPA: NAD(P)H-dependent oxidoreductase [Leptospiraceae bacterium]|nr:NAD(P)H-dependent oxidoreductase [Leptospiraceae bacterium]HMW05553.1 NAD(P)H-dependent oxidoreductase [Leptospiraceae bacterium]HMX32864.1 NAD(P)H-dependent oxidoreductase [Leptospiraceae bacterium]HMY31063.1 NAD(P)H-dependent oxidoreductase [Leptospiraceae bacterium]HMZ66342.1 NAD(P)H-dependent oxidoreductase [Leptospiraceae bacterium]
MNYLLIYAHSNPKSFTNAVYQSVYAELSLKGASIQVIDLYKDKFNPILYVDENHRRRDLFKDPETLIYRNKIERADHLIFIYPVWWHGFPAILKGFIDRVISSEFAYSFKNKNKDALFPEGLLSDKKISCFYTLDAPSLVAFLDPGWLSIKYTIFKYCGFKQVERYYLSNLKHLDDKKRREWLLKCRKIVRTFKN